MRPIRATAARVRAAVPKPPPLHDDWRGILGRAWSARFMILAIVLSGAEAVLPLFAGQQLMPMWLFAPLNFAIVGAALWARLTVQKVTGATE